MDEWDATDGDSDEEEIWRDLVARYDGQGEADQGSAPWPERENLRTSLHGEQTPGQPGPGPESGPAGPFANGREGDPDGGLAGFPDGRPAGNADRWPAANADGHPASNADGGLAGNRDGDLAGNPGGSGADGLPGPASPADALSPDDDHFVPPPPPPLPRLEPVVKGAWLALFGGPLYLLVATAAGWTVQGWAAFCAMAAFVAGFVVLVLHLGNDRRDNGSGSDDGAVV